MASTTEPLTVRMFPPVSSGSAYLRALADALTRLGHVVDDTAHSPDVFHHHWPESPFNAPTRWEMTKGVGSYLLEMNRLQRRGAALIWTVHNLEAHEGGQRGEGPYLRTVARLTDGWLTLSDHACVEAIQRWPVLLDKPHTVIPHGDLTAVLPSPTSRQEARLELGLADKPTIAFVGAVRPYKGVEDLLVAAAPLLDEGIQLLIAGLVHADCASVRDHDRRCVLIDRSLSDSEYVAAIASADLVVLPFRRITHSGSLVTAVGLRRPVLAPDLGAVSEMAESLRGGVRLYQPPLTSAQLKASLAWARSTRIGADVLAPHNWDRVGQRVVSVYERAVAVPRRSPSR